MWAIGLACLGVSVHALGFVNCALKREEILHFGSGHLSILWHSFLQYEHPMGFSQLSLYGLPPAGSRLSLKEDFTLRVLLLSLAGSDLWRRAKESATCAALIRSTSSFSSTCAKMLNGNLLFHSSRTILFTNSEKVVVLVTSNHFLNSLNFSTANST